MEGFIMKRSTLAGVQIAVVLAGAWCAMAQELPPQPQPPQPEPAPAQPEKGDPATPPDEPLPSLDDLLGLPGSGNGVLDDPSKTDLDRQLSGAEIGNAFKQAVTLMGDVAKRMTDSSDAGLTTQRM